MEDNEDEINFKSVGMSADDKAINADKVEK